MPTLPTFRDPDGFCFLWGDRFLRVIHPQAVDRVRTLVDSKLIHRLVEEDCLPRTRVLDAVEAAQLLADSGVGWSAHIGLAAMVLEHERIPFVSYPHEWCPEMLYAAGELTLELQLRALDEGHTLKDATPTNILFAGHQPVFVDFLSFVPRTSGTAVWTAYAQFVRTFLLPLLLHRKLGIATHDLFLGRRDGVEPEEVYRQLSGLGRLSPLALQYVSAPTWLGRTQAGKDAAPASAGPYDEERAIMISRMLVRGLQRALRKVLPHSLRESTWSDYMATSSYQGESFRAKERFVKAAIAELAPQTVLDVGCNTGHFSCMAAALGASVVALDYDSVVVGRLWNRVRAEKVAVVPLVMNLARPSPGLGWRNRENDSFLTRAEGKFDVALLLAVLHHLTVTDGVPLAEIFHLMAQMVLKGLIIEYVPPSDPMFQKIIRNKEHLISKLQQPDFEVAFAPWFVEVHREILPESGRILYVLRKKNLQSTRSRS